jgi:hypothetical protein
MKKIARTIRSGFTLIELVLSLAITIVIAGLIGLLINIYANQLEESGEIVKQTQLARSILHTIGDDIRSVIRYQEYDPSVLEQIITDGMGSMTGGMTGGGDGGGGAGGGSSSGGSGSGTGGASAGAGSGGAPSGASSGGSSSSSGSGSAGITEETTEEKPLPPGIYGGDTWIQLDVSRLPRPDEYFPTQVNPLSGSLADVPSAVKTVTYLIQSTSAGGVQDVFANMASSATGQGIPAGLSGGGLVRRQLDRSILQWASANSGQMQQVNQTGDLMSPEVVGLAFSYFDGATWYSSWDASTQGTPWVIQIELALQDAKGMRENPVIPGVNIRSLTATQLLDSRIRLFQLMVAIPGAPLLAAPAAQSESGGDSGMGSLGL